jgi:hypothetical protein
MSKYEYITVDMIGPGGRRRVPEKDARVLERHGWIRVSDLPAVEDAPASGQPMPGVGKPEIKLSVPKRMPEGGF